MRDFRELKVWARGHGLTGFTSELEYHPLLVRDLELLDESVHESPTKEATEVKRMLMSFIQKPEADS